MRSVLAVSKNKANEPMGLALRMMEACSDDDSEEGGSSPSVRIDLVGILIATGFAISCDPSRLKLDWKPERSSENSR